MKLARSSFYHKSRDKSPKKMQKEADLRGKIEAICLEFPRYGYRWVTQQLKRDGLCVNHKKVLRIIKGMVISNLNQVWLSDITYIRIRTGFVYLAAILDVLSRKVIGYAVSTTLDITLTLQALKMAIARRRPDPGVIHHSDQGVQYASGEYVEQLSRHGFLARGGTPIRV